MEKDLVKTNPNKKKTYSGIEGFAKNLFLFNAILSIVFIILIFVFIFSRAWPFLKDYGLINFITGRVWKPTAASPQFGILPMIVGTFYITGIAVLLAIPLGISTAIYLAFEAEGKIYKILKASINLMAGVPSIVYGFFALNIIVPFVRRSFGGMGISILSAGVILFIMILPTIVSISESALRAVNESYYQASVALGASHERSIVKVVLPAAKSGIFAGVVLGIGRAVGETTAILLVAGNQPRITGNILKGIRTLTTNIIIEMGYAGELHTTALIATGAVLFTIIFIINVSLFFYKRRKVQ